MPTSNSSTSSIQNFLSNIHALYLTHVFPYLPEPVQAVSSRLDPILQSGDIVSLAAFLLVLYLSIRIADYVRRSVFAWIVFMLKIAILLGLIQLGLYIRTYGWENTLNTAGWLGGLVWGYVEEALQGDDKSYGGKRYDGGKYGTGWNLGGGRQEVPGWKRGAGAGAGTRRRGGWT